MYRCTSKLPEMRAYARGRMILMGLVALLLVGAVACTEYNSGSNELPQGYTLSGMGPFEPAPNVQLCSGTSTIERNYEAVASPKSNLPTECTTNDDCPERTRCNCGQCVPNICSSFLDCGTDDCLDNHCLPVCDPNSPKPQCPKGSVCSKEFKVCRPTCKSNLDCSPGESCEQTEDGKVCVVRLLDKRQQPNENEERVLISAGINPSSPSAMIANNEMLLFFTVQDANGTGVFLARAQVPKDVYVPIILSADVSAPVASIDQKRANVSVFHTNDKFYIAYKDQTGSTKYLSSEEPDGPYQVETIDTNPIPGSSYVKFSSGTGKLFATAINQDGALVVGISDTGRIEDLSIIESIAIAPSDADSKGLQMLDACTSNENCSTGLYCFIQESDKTGMCLPKDCSECPQGTTCSDTGCVCEDANTCPTPNVSPVWLGVSKFSSASILPLSDTKEVIYFSAKGQTSMLAGSDYSIGAAVIEERNVYMPFGNPVFDPSMLSFHYNEQEPSAIRIGDDQTLLFFTDGRRISAARCPQKSLIDF